MYAAAHGGRGGRARRARARADRASTTAPRPSATASSPTPPPARASAWAARSWPRSLTYVLLGFGGAELPGAQDLLTRALGTVLYCALMGATGGALGLAARSAAPPVIAILAVLLFLEPLFAGLSDPVARWGPGGAAAALTASSTEDVPPAWAGGLDAAGLRRRRPRRRPRPSPDAATYPSRMLASVDGAIGPADQARIPVTDEGLLRGDGGFDALRLYGGRPCALAAHLARFERTCAGLRLTVDHDALQAEIQAMLDGGRARRRRPALLRHPRRPPDRAGRAAPAPPGDRAAGHGPLRARTASPTA